MYKISKLKNGLTILKVPIRGAKSVLVDVFVKTGSRHELARINGISHFLEHLFFKGSKAYPTAQDLSHALDAIGAEYNANTGKEHTQYYIKAARKHQKFIFEVLMDMIQNPIFDTAEIEREKGVIIEEINMYEDTPMRHVEDLLEELMWPNLPLGRNIAGTKPIIKQIQRQDILDYVKAFYKPKNMIIAISGSYDERLLSRQLAEAWANIPDQAFPAWQKATVSQSRPMLRIENRKTEQYHIAFGFRSFDYNHQANIPQMVLATILGGGMSSRLFTEIRERRGLAYYVKAAAGNYQDTGNFVIQAGIRRESLVDAVQVILAELGKIKTESVRPKELTKAKEYIKGTLTLSLETSENLLGWYLEQVAFRKKILEPEQVFAEIDRVGSDQVRRVAKQIFTEKGMNVSIIGPKESAGRIGRFLHV